MKNRQSNTKLMNSRRSLLTNGPCEQSHITLTYKQAKKNSLNKTLNDQVIFNYSGFYYPKVQNSLIEDSNYRPIFNVNTMDKQGIPNDELSIANYQKIFQFEGVKSQKTYDGLNDQKIFQFYAIKSLKTYKRLNNDPDDQGLYKLPYKNKKRIYKGLNDALNNQELYNARFMNKKRIQYDLKPIYDEPEMHFLDFNDFKYRKITDKNITEKEIKSSIVKNAMMNFVFDIHNINNTGCCIDKRNIIDFDLTTIAMASVIFEKSQGLKLCSLDEFIVDFFVCCVLAYKYRDDYVVMNSSMIENTIISIREFNFAEARILNNIQYNLTFLNESLDLTTNNNISTKNFSP